MDSQGISVSEMIKKLEERGPSALCGDAAALTAALALALGGGAKKPRLALKFDKAPVGSETEEAKPRERESVLVARLLELAETDEQAEDAFRSALRKPAMLPADKEKRREKLEESYWSAGSVTLNLMRAVIEAVKLMAAKVGAAAPLEAASTASALALSSGALNALEIEALSRAAGISDATRAGSLRRSAALLKEEGERVADEAFKELRASLARQD